MKNVRSILLKVSLGIVALLIFTHDYEVEVENSPGRELMSHGYQIQAALDAVIGEYSIETWAKYSGLGERKANFKFGDTLSELKEKYGSTEQCATVPFKYMKRDYFITEETYFWRWESKCSFEKGRGMAVVDFVINYSGLELLRWEIKSI
ncbi:hypothetical protein [Marinobacter sp. HN1S83]|uniref:hypothetical protein n=1 Tax=Marinobacter sp. HN1S83 TaxID=3382301 RepID=UPI00387AABE2